MADLSQQTAAIPPAAEGTQVVPPLSCAVCGEENPPGEVWCRECGFRLGDEPGEAPEASGPTEAGALVLSATGQRLPLVEGRNELGRAGGLAIADPSVSRRHAAIFLEEGGAWLEDLGSTNGTYLEGSRLQAGDRLPLRDGQAVRFGTVAARVELSEAFRGAADAPEKASRPPAGADLVLRGPEGLELPVPEGPLTLGRRADCDLRLQDPYVSGVHARLVREGVGLTVTDLGSTNGTFVRGERLTPHAPAPVGLGEEVVFGRVALILARVESDGADASEDEEGASAESEPAL